MKSCEFCQAWVEDTNNPNLGREGECRLDPPKTHLVVVPVRTIQGDAMNAQVMTVFPRVSFEKFCMGYAPKLND